MPFVKTELSTADAAEAAAELFAAAGLPDEAAPQQHHISVEKEKDGYVRLTFDYDKEAVAWAKDFDNRQYHEDRKLWVVPATENNVAKLREPPAGLTCTVAPGTDLSAEQAAFATAVRAQKEQRQQLAEPEQKEQKAVVTASIAADGKTAELAFDYSKESVDFVRSLDGSRFSKETKAWSVPLTDKNLAALAERGIIEPEAEIEKAARSVLQPAALQAPTPKLDGIGGSDVEPESDGVRRTRLGNIISSTDQPFSLKEPGAKMLTQHGHTVVETDRALIAPPALFVSREKEQQRAEAMVEAAAEKFKGRALRIDGKPEFVSAAIDAALARGLTVEVNEKYAQLLADKEAALARGNQQIDGSIAASDIKSVSAGEITASDKRQVMTGTLLDVEEKDGSRLAHMRQAGRDTYIMTSLPAETLLAEKGQGVRIEAGGGRADSIVNLRREKAQDAGLGLSR